MASSSSAPTNRWTVFGEMRYEKKRTLYMSPWAAKQRARVSQVGWATVRKVLSCQHQPVYGCHVGSKAHNRCIRSFSASSSMV